MRNVFVILSLALVTQLTFAQTAPLSATSIEQSVLETEIRQNVLFVDEFRYLREEANRMGVKIYLYGGAASALAHYSRWNALRESGDAFFKEREFPMKIDRIFKPGQDVDMVVDGTPEQAHKLEELISEKYPRLSGKRTLWEARALSIADGEKKPLLGDADFLRQNLDSGSTGLLDLTAKEGEPITRDLKTWDGGKNYFLIDAASGKITFYESEFHATTERASQGLNPEIIGAIRFLTKKAQYGLSTDADSEARIRRIIDAFNPESVKSTKYVIGWMAYNAPKLINNAFNPVETWEYLEKIGLTKKLIDLGIQGDFNSVFAERPTPKKVSSAEPFETRIISDDPRVRSAAAKEIKSLPFWDASEKVVNALKAELVRQVPNTYVLAELLESANKIYRWQQADILKSFVPRIKELIGSNERSPFNHTLKLLEGAIESAEQIKVQPLQNRPMPNKCLELYG